MKKVQTIEKLMKVLQDNVEFSYQISLTRLVDGVSTYEFTCDGGKTKVLFSDLEEAHEYIEKKKYYNMAVAALGVMKEIPIRPKVIGDQFFVVDIEWSQTDKHSVIISAIDETHALSYAKKKYSNGRYISCVRRCGSKIEVAGE